MGKEKAIFVVFSVIIIMILFGFFQYTIILKKQNDLLIANIDSIEKQIISFEYRNNIERWHARLADLNKENGELKSKVAILEAFLAQETAKTATSTAKEKPKGNKGFLFKKR